MERFIAFLAALGVWFADAWGLMVTVGIAHDSWWSRVPVMGYSTALSISGVGVVSLIIAVFLIALVKELF